MESIRIELDALFYDWVYDEECKIGKLSMIYTNEWKYLPPQHMGIQEMESHTGTFFLPFFVNSKS